jgi:aminopeptidase N
MTDLTGRDLDELDIVPGKMVITKLFVNGVEANYKLEQTLCEIDLEKSIEPGESLEITMEFYQNIPKNRDRYGFYYDANQNEVISLGNWCPILAVYDDEGWHKDQFLPIGDPFYSDSSIYEINIMLPEYYVLASTGELFNKEKVDDYVIYTYKAYPVRDFAIMFSKEYDILVDEYQDIDIYSYLVEEDLEKFKYSINWAKEAIAIFSELFGKYPYKSYSIAQNFSNFGGMEYPQLCQIKYVDKGYRENIDEKYYYYRNEYVIAHETAHQWWYSVVGNNEIDEPWLDEAFAEYSTCQYFINKYGEDRGIEFFSMIRPGPLSIEVPSKVMNKTIRDYTDFGQYSRDIYSGGAELLFRLEEHLGRDIMHKILKEYFEEYKFENVDIRGFINICEEVSGKDLSKFFSPYFNDF